MIDVDDAPAPAPLGQFTLGPLHAAEVARRLGLDALAELVASAEQPALERLVGGGDGG